MVDIETNPLYYAAAGGILLGISTSLNYVLRGNITGMSGIIYDVAFFNTSQFPKKLAIIGGLIIASGIFFDVFGYGTYNNFTPFGSKQNISEFTSYLGFALSGFLTGFGTKLSNGCTSGHGLCGLSRLSLRSFVAVGIFLTTAISIATIKHYVTLGPFSQQFNLPLEYNHLISANVCIALGILCVPVGFLIEKYYNKQDQDPKIIFRDIIISLLVGLIFGAGLVVAGMARRRNILSFLAMGKNWNPSLLFVLGCGVMFNLIVFNYMIRIKKIPILGGQLFNPSNSVVDWKLIVGALCFGLGWGIGGICPGPALVLLPVFQVQIHVVWIACLILGMFIAGKLIGQDDKKIGFESAEAQQPSKSRPSKPIQVTDLVQNSAAINLNNSSSIIELDEVKRRRPEVSALNSSQMVKEEPKGSSDQSPTKSLKK